MNDPVENKDLGLLGTAFYGDPPNPEETVFEIAATTHEVHGRMRLGSFTMDRTH